MVRMLRCYRPDFYILVMQRTSARLRPNSVNTAWAGALKGILNYYTYMTAIEGLYDEP